MEMIRVPQFQYLILDERSKFAKIERTETRGGVPTLLGYFIVSNCPH